MERLGPTCERGLCLPVDRASWASCASPPTVCQHDMLPFPKGRHAAQSAGTPLGDPRLALLAKPLQEGDLHQPLCLGPEILRPFPSF